MQKVIVVSGCKDCSYKQFNRELENYECYKFGFDLGSNPPETPHPNCKLNDLPEMERINKYVDATIPTGHPYNQGFNNGFKQGANYVLKEITK